MRGIGYLIAYGMFTQAQDHQMVFSHIKTKAPHGLLPVDLSKIISLSNNHFALPLCVLSV